MLPVVDARNGSKADSLEAEFVPYFCKYVQHAGMRSDRSGDVYLDAECFGHVSKLDEVEVTLHLGSEHHIDFAFRIPP
jgi:hypothetical protein